LRRIQDPEGAQQIDDFVKKFVDLKTSKFTFVGFQKYICSIL
jgi:hypothetical protein